MSEIGSRLPALAVLGGGRGFCAASACGSRRAVRHDAELQPGLGRLPGAAGIAALSAALRGKSPGKGARGSPWRARRRPAAGDPACEGGWGAGLSRARSARRIRVAVTFLIVEGLRHGAHVRSPGESLPRTAGRLCRGRSTPARLRSSARRCRSRSRAAVAAWSGSARILPAWSQ